MKLKNEEIIKVFKSGNIVDINKTLDVIRISGHPELLIPLAELLLINIDKEIKTKIVNLFNDIKNKNAIPFLIDIVKEKKNKPILNLIISACWQNTLNFKDHLELFVAKFLSEEYTTAIEAFTVIENTIFDNEYTDQELEKVVNTLKDGITNHEESMKLLIVELINTINQKKEV